MDNIERRYKAMFDRVIGLYDVNKTIFDTKPLIKQHFIEVTVIRNAMQLAMNSQAGGSTKGSTEDLIAQKRLTSELAHSVVKKVRPYAKTKSNELLEKVDHSFSDFNDTPHEEFPGKVRNFTGAVRAELPNLTLYEVTDAELELVETGVDTFDALNTGRDMKGNDREVATANIPKHRKLAMKVLDLLDDLVPGQLGAVDPELVKKYVGLRELVG